MNWQAYGDAMFSQPLCDERTPPSLEHSPAKPVPSGQSISLSPWNLAVIEEK